MIPIIDIFAGPGGLGEGFTSFRNSRGAHPFEIALSIEKERYAHETLRLRAFARRFRGSELPAEYIQLLRGELAWAELKTARTSSAAAIDAEAEARCLTLGPRPDVVEQVRRLIDAALPSSQPWVLVGGPPCQAYSLVGRARNSGRIDYDPEADHRQTLYVEYLQILADHAPTLFVMENVKGLLSAEHRNQRMFDRIREDLEHPAAAIIREGRQPRRRGAKYTLHSLVVPANEKELSPADFVIRAENYGIPQRRHRVIIVGVLEGANLEIGRLQPAFGPSVEKRIGSLPRLRSGLSEGDDRLDAWRSTLRSFAARRWVKRQPTELRLLIEGAIETAQSAELDRGANYSKRHGRSLLNHATRSHMPMDLARYLFVSAYGKLHRRSPTLPDFPSDLLPQHANVEAALDGGLFADRFRVQIASGPSTTITSHIAKDGHYFIHFDPAQCRSLTVREAATLQTFPADYFFCGPRTAQYTQVGNAVPPELAARIAGVIAKAMGKG